MQKLQIRIAYLRILGPVWYSFMSSFTSNFTTSIAKQPTLCPTPWSASLKTHSHRVKHMVKLQKHDSLPRSWSCSWSCFLKNSSTGEAELCQMGPYSCWHNLETTWLMDCPCRIKSKLAWIILSVLVSAHFKPAQIKMEYQCWFNLKELSVQRTYKWAGTYSSLFVLVYLCTVQMVRH
jgi:hypothetical protein